MAYPQIEDSGEHRRPLVSTVTQHPLRDSDIRGTLMYGGGPDVRGSLTGTRLQGGNTHV